MTRNQWFLLGFVVVVGAIVVVTQIDDSPDQPGDPTGAELLELLATWNRGNDALDHFEFADAEREFRKVAERLPDSAAAWINTAIASMNQEEAGAFQRARIALERGLAIEPDHSHGNHCLGILLKHLSDFEGAEVCFRKVLAADPHDPTACYYLGTLVLSDDRVDEAEALFKTAIAAEPHQQSAIYQLFGAYLKEGQDDEAEPLIKLFRDLEEAGVGNRAGIVYGDMGRYGSGIKEFPVAIPPGIDRSGGVSYAATAISGGPLLPALLPGAMPAMDDAAAVARAFAKSMGGGVAVADVDGDGDLDAWAADGTGAGSLFLNQAGKFSKAGADWGIAGVAPSISGCFADYDNDGWVDLYVCCAGPNRLFRNLEGKRFEDVTAASGTSGGNVFTAQAVMTDLDSDGDVDIYCANLASLDEEGAEKRPWPAEAKPVANNLFNNERTGAFTDIAVRTRTAGAQRSIGVVAADLDGDRDADLLVFGFEGPPILHQNDRIWRFVDATESAGLSNVRARGASVVDVECDGHWDLLLWGDQSALYRGLGRLKFARADELPAGPGCALDADNDGDVDVLSVATLALQTPDGWTRTATGVAGTMLETAVSMVPADFHGDGVLDVVVGRGYGEPVFLRGSLDRDHAWVEIALKGVREEGKMRANTGGVGARVSVIAGADQQWQQILTASSTLGSPSGRLHFGLGAHTEVDYVSLKWPDDLLQGESKIPVGALKTITQIYRKSSSCPLLFAWDGERMAFVTDFLGVGGLGFFLEPGQYAPPDPTELVHIPNLVAKDGHWTLSIHEAMEEICYLDEAKLIVVEHPDGFVCVPDERLAVLGPQPDGRLITFRPDEAVYPATLSTRDGNADVELLLKSDRRYQPGVHADKRFIGFAEEQEIVVDFGDALASTTGRPLVLFLDGWVEYPYSHVNFAAWQAGLVLSGLSIDIRQPDGTWKVFRDNFGYPAGMPRVMTLEVSDLPRDGRCVLRLRTNQELYIDRLWLAPDHGSKVATVTELSPDVADFFRSGYPREYSPDGHEPLLYDYQLMDPAIDYKGMAGEYTRFGDVRELLEAPDDRYVIFGRAEEVLLKFKAMPAPAAGRTRSFILKSDGYCKDMDLYTAFPHTVGPLPFHGMSGYPYSPSESYPTSPEHQAYRREWNTRRIR